MLSFEVFFLEVAGWFRRSLKRNVLKGEGVVSGHVPTVDTGCINNQTTLNTSNELSPKKLVSNLGCTRPTT